MAEMRLIDANIVGEGMAIKWQKALVKAEISDQPTIDPETLPIVRELRDENIKAECRADALMAKILVLEEQLAQVTAELDVAWTAKGGRQ